MLIPPTCPHCSADLTEEDALREDDYLPVWYGGRRLPNGEWENDGNGFEWGDQDGDDSRLVCQACERVVVPPKAVRVPADVWAKMQAIAESVR